MIKAVFLVGKGMDIMTSWNGITKKRSRILGANKSFNGFEAIEASIYDRKNQTKKTFLFFLLESEEEIPNIVSFMKMENREVVTVISSEDKEIAERLVEIKNKRYHYVRSYGWIFFLRETVKEKIINEFISSFFEEIVSEKLIAAIERNRIANERNCLQIIRKMKAGI